MGLFFWVAHFSVGEREFLEFQELKRAESVCTEPQPLACLSPGLAGFLRQVYQKAIFSEIMPLLSD